jgi:Reverse transcriptase (RNA-dependent DNA polymerase)
VSGYHERFCLLQHSGSIILLQSVPIDPKDRDKTAFKTRRGQFRYQTVSVGGVNAPSVLCRLMALVLKNLNLVSCLVYIDGTVVLGKTFQQHVDNLEVVLDRFRQANLKLKPTKCKLFQTHGKFLGNIVSEKKLEVDPDKVNCILAWPFPRILAKLRGFVGIC